MQAAIGNIELAFIDSNNEDVKRYLSNALTTLENAKTLSNKLITFSKGGVPIRQIMPLSPWIRDITVHYSYGLNLEYSFDIPENLYLVNIDAE